MRIVHLGVGEAFDQALPNNSHLTEGAVKLLLDIGYSAPGPLWRHDSDPDFLDVIYVSHGHADHCFGLPPLLVRMREDGRKKPLKIVCGMWLEEKLEKIIDLGYPDTLEKCDFDVDILGVGEGDTVDIGPLELSFAPTLHSVDNLGVRMTDGASTLFYSGDGRPTPPSLALCQGADLVIHEAYLFQRQISGHGNIKELVQEMEARGVKALALTHIQRGCRREMMGEITAYAGGREMEVYLPMPGDERVIGPSV